ncbi:porin family protein [Vibrio neonatus]|uniref:porin family protein n=1 Tax=Vibrio neonatus TaxID=278860 RepID=UPI0021C26E1A|nr:porin family protein [Vibrio neonatus]
MYKIFSASIGALSLLSAGCASHIPIEDVEPTRKAIKAESSALIEKMASLYPEVEKELSNSVGYATASMSGVNVVVLGGGYGRGMIENKLDGSITYLDVKRYDLGAGLGLGTYDVLAIFDDEDALQRYKERNWRTSVGAQWNVNEAGSSAYTDVWHSNYDVSLYVASNSGAVAQGSARLVSISTNYDLTNTGLGSNRVANINHTINNDPVSDSSPSDDPKVWDRALPFFAQNVVEQGFDLPLPFGVSIIYVQTEQAMTLRDLEIGFNGGDKTPTPFVSFSDNSAVTYTPQLKLDAWLFPFMNVFASVGAINGHALVNFTLDGNGIIDMAGANCGRLPIEPVCAFEDKSLTVATPEIDINGVNYTVGTVLAAGWNDYFFVLPISYSYADMQGSVTKGDVWNISPRLGKQFPLQGSQSIAVFVGATYLDSRLTITGSVDVPGAGSTLQTIDYKLEQENLDKWMALAGMNYNFNREWSLSVEYGQKSSDKKQFISSLNYRY